jgi:hypothetical protein
MMVYITGRISLFVMTAVYATVGILLIVRRDNAHRVKIYHSQAYIDCDIDGDDDSSTCVSDYTVVKTMGFNAGYVFGTALLISAAVSFAQIFIQRDHVYSKVYYIDTVLSNSIMTFAVAVVTGIQGLFTLILMMLNTTMYELGIYLHDKWYWETESSCPYHNKGKLVVIMTLNLITMTVNLAALIDYWSVSSIPAFIPLIMLLWYIHFFMLRYFSYRYFYDTLPEVLSRGAHSESNSLFDKSSGSETTRYEVVVKEDPFVIDWLDSWKYGLNFAFKIAVALCFYIGTNHVQITYK